jgi:hypothetical protein
MKALELLYGLTERQMVEALDPQQPEPEQMSSPIDAAPTSLTGTSGDPGATGPMQMASNAPAPMMPAGLGDDALAKLQRADSIAQGPHGSQSPMPTMGNFFQNMVGRPPLPLK